MKKKKTKQNKTNSSQFLTRIASHPRNKNKRHVRVCDIPNFNIRGNVPLKLVTKRVHIYNLLSFSRRLIIYTKHEKIDVNTFPNHVRHYILKWLKRNRDKLEFFEKLVT